MKKENNKVHNETMDQTQEQKMNETVGKKESESQENCDCGNLELEILKTKLQEQEKQSEEYLNMLQRTVAEFDNYKKRTAREKENLYNEAVSDSIQAILPVVDSLDRAIQATSKNNDEQSILEGVELVHRLLKDALKKLGVEEIKSTGEKFDPQIHNAVMHICDEAYDGNVVVEELQKGYIIKDKVIRHCMVKVAN